MPIRPVATKNPEGVARQEAPSGVLGALSGVEANVSGVPGPNLALPTKA